MGRETAKDSQVDEAQVDAVHQTPIQPKPKHSPIKWDRSPEKGKEKEKKPTRVKERLGNRQDKEQQSQRKPNQYQGETRQPPDSGLGTKHLYRLH